MAQAPTRAHRNAPKLHADEKPASAVTITACRGRLPIRRDSSCKPHLARSFPPGVSFTFLFVTMPAGLRHAACIHVQPTSSMWRASWASASGGTGCAGYLVVARYLRVDRYDESGLRSVGAETAKRLRVVSTGYHALRHIRGFRER